MSLKIDKNFENLIIKYINQNNKTEDLKLLLNCLKDSKNLSLFKLYIKINFFSIYVMNSMDKDEIIDIIKNKIKKDQKREKRKKYFIESLKYAAVCVAVFYLSHFYTLNQINSTEISEVIIPNEDEIFIENEKGEIFLIEKIDSIEISKNSYKESNRIVYEENIVVETEKVEVHTINVPYGKRFNLQLSDGTDVYLNSGTIMKYPVSFLPNQTRSVHIEGEAFFNVKKAANSIFEVRSNQITASVYGTKFNFKNFSEDFSSDIVLVEGSLGISNENTTDINMLSPGYKASIDKEIFKISKSKVNSKIYTSWVDGDVIFRNETFDQIIQKLQRLYNITIINNSKISNQLFNASINVEEEKIEDVLGYFNKIYNIDFQIFNNKIIIN
jgi:transmembrane sensor